MTPDFKNLLDFVAFTKKYREVERQVVWKANDRKENDAEHSYQLAMVAWYLISSGKLDLNIDKVIRYALAHDIVEIYAGDTPLSTATEQDKAGKADREHAALVRIEKEFSQFPDMTEAIHEYEKRDNKESRFIYALDKILPVLDIYLDDGHSWKMNHMTLNLIVESKTEKVALSPEVKPYFDELVSIMRANEKTLFNDFDK